MSQSMKMVYGSELVDWARNAQVGEVVVLVDGAEVLDRNGMFGKIIEISDSYQLVVRIEGDGGNDWEFGPPIVVRTSNQGLRISGVFEGQHLVRHD